MAALRVGVVTFPGSLDDRDAARAVRLVGATPVPLWHGTHDLDGVDALILPGGFSYGDYLRAGAIASLSPIMAEVVAAATAGMPVLGICNGFQMLTEARLLPGGLIRNDHGNFVCRDQRLRVENTSTAWTAAFADASAGLGAATGLGASAGSASALGATSAGAASATGTFAAASVAGSPEITIPLKNGEGGYIASADTLDRLEGEGHVVFRYLDVNPNGSMNDIAGVTNARGNVVGLMPHPEHAVEPGFGPDTPSAMRSGTDGLPLFASALAALLPA